MQTNGRIVERGCADINASRRPRQLGGGEPSILAGFERQLEQEPLLRIHLLRLARGDAKDARVKAPDVRQHSRRPGVTSAGFFDARVTMSVQRPTSGGY